MVHTLDKIASKPTDYHFCSSCGIINWHENETCINCGHDHFEKSDDLHLEWVNNEYEFWEQDEEYTEQEANNVEYEV